MFKNFIGGKQINVFELFSNYFLGKSLFYLKTNRHAGSSFQFFPGGQGGKIENDFLGGQIKKKIVGKNTK